MILPRVSCSAAGLGRLAQLPTARGAARSLLGIYFIYPALAWRSRLPTFSGCQIGPGEPSFWLGLS